MTIAYHDILLWGHSFDAYKNMFNLTKDDLESTILDCCGGPSSFNAELTARGGHVTSTDPLFSLTNKKLQSRIEAVFTEMLLLLEEHKDRFNWKDVQSPEALAEQRRKNIKIFLQDFQEGIKEGRYLPDVPPDLPFQHYQFDLALCSHFLFANNAEKASDYHLDVITKLTDVAKEVRIFPLLDSTGEIPAVVGPVSQGLYELGYGVEIKAVPYQFQKKGNAMLRVWAQTCEI